MEGTSQWLSPENACKQSLHTWNSSISWSSPKDFRLSNQYQIMSVYRFFWISIFLPSAVRTEDERRKISDTCPRFFYRCVCGQRAASQLRHTSEQATTHLDLADAFYTRFLFFFLRLLFLPPNRIKYMKIKKNLFLLSNSRLCENG